MLLFKFLLYANSFCKRQPRTRKFYKTLIVAILVLTQTKNQGKLALLENNVPIKIFLRDLATKYAYFNNKEFVAKIATKYAKLSQGYFVTTKATKYAK